jgi:hypothetical protein
MLEVRIRHENESKPMRLAVIEFEDIDTFFNVVKSWGVYADGAVAETFSGQFVVADDAAYFEIICHGKE